MTTAQRPLIAVIGDASRTTDPSVAKRAGRELGNELRKRNCRLIVFSSSAQFIEWEAVQGYRDTTDRLPPGSIEVRYPPELHSLFPDETPDDPVFVRRQQGNDWEASIYPSFAEIDGIALVGGAYTTKIAGLLAMGSKTPVITLAGLGGGAREVWNCLKGDRNSPSTQEDLDLMISPEWSDTSAARLMNCLINQMKRQQEISRLAALGEDERHRQHVLTMLATIGSVCFLAVLLSLTQLPALNTLPFWFRCLLLIAPALAGASGAAIRVLWDNWNNRAVPLDLRPISMTIVLGFWAAGAVAAMFLLEQIWIADISAGTLINKFFGISVVIGLIAGLSLNRVFPRLIQTDIPIKMDIGEVLNPKSTRGRKAG